MAIATSSVATSSVATSSLPRSSTISLPRSHCHRLAATAAQPPSRCHRFAATISLPRSRCHNLARCHGLAATVSRAATVSLPLSRCHDLAATVSLPRSRFSSLPPSHCHRLAATASRCTASCCQRLSLPLTPPRCHRLAATAALTARSRALPSRCHCRGRAMLSVFFNTLLMCVLLSQCELIPTMGSHVLLKGTMVRTSNVLCIATHTVPRTYPYLVGVALGILSMRRSWSAGGLHTTLDTIIL